ncbi:hypothetical protein [Streptomyces rubradiris]|uniref:TrbL/VirB6 plasmid conjugal transfer protein n=1 Tax=Streptomyces rubradiris TaxID=285531 RepID=A0ABQ3RA19_STRRR|nr:hypothetical protein [Streptomyces rubradiris]GHH25697.1 hypothetical protein GCM10018792_65010 [Streptomyces rubradiris]GHI52705.1 hypothetical protein Srubr_25510 [Streptomyces rubradiris]
MARALARLATLLAAVLVLMASGTSIALAGAKPPDPLPANLNDHRWGINTKTGEYCDQDDPNAATRKNCRAPVDCEDFPQDGTTSCVSEGVPEEAEKFELNELNRWLAKADKNQPNYEKIKDYLTKCVKKDGKSFAQCKEEANGKWPPPAKTPIDWVMGKISEAAANALQEAAAALGHSVVWLLKQFAEAFNAISSINLAEAGISPVLGISWGLSLVVATFLLLVQFAKVAVSHRGGPAATAIVGLAKWAAILSVYLFATQVALNWSDSLSTALINYSFDGGGTTSGDASKAMETQLGTLFSGLVGTGAGGTAGAALITGSGMAPASVGFVIVISILCILAIGALWMEMLIRQAGIMILVTMMPLALAGQMSDATKEWWPKARNALISLILMKPVVVICFSIGFSAMASGEGVRNVIVGLIVFVVAAFSWPVLAKFIVITSNGDGTSAASGMISSIGSSVGTLFGGNQPSLSGAGMVGGGANYTKALEGETSASADGGSAGGGFWSKAMKGRASGSFMSKAGGVVGTGLQLAAVGKDISEGTFQNAAANAGLGHGAQGGRHVVVPPRTGSDTPASPPSRPADPSPTQESEPPPQVPARPPQQTAARPPQQPPAQPPSKS